MLTHSGLHKIMEMFYQITWLKCDVDLPWLVPVHTYDCTLGFVKVWQDTAHINSYHVFTIIDVHQQSDGQAVITNHLYWCIPLYVQLMIRYCVKPLQTYMSCLWWWSLDYDMNMTYICECNAWKEWASYGLTVISNTMKMYDYREYWDGMLFPLDLFCWRCIVQ